MPYEKRVFARVVCFGSTLDYQIFTAAEYHIGFLKSWQNKVNSASQMRGKNAMVRMLGERHWLNRASHFQNFDLTTTTTAFWTSKLKPLGSGCFLKNRSGENILRQRISSNSFLGCFSLIELKERDINKFFSLVTMCNWI